MTVRRASLLLLLLVIPTARVPSCPVMPPFVIFTDRSEPTERDYHTGKLGVVFPDYPTRYLAVAYRYLSNVPLTAEEQKAYTPDGDPRGSSGVPAWQEFRQKLGPTKFGKGEVDALRSVGAYMDYVNCPADAFRTAIATYTARQKEFGASHPGVKAWLEAQDLVFQSCGGGSFIPPDADPSWPAKLRADRDYQIAAAHFYSQSYDEARLLFTKIAADRNSPWRDSAPYIAARVLLRKATVTPNEGFDSSLLEQAEQELAKINTPQSHRLRRFAAIRLRPEEELAAIGRDIANPRQQADYAQNLRDYSYSFRKLEEAKKSAKTLDDYTDWIFTFRSVRAPQDATHALERFRATKSHAWLIAAMATAVLNQPANAELLEASRRIPPDSPAYATAAYQRIRLLTESGKPDEARADLDQALPLLGRREPQSAINLFLSQRLVLARNLDEFLRFAPRQSAGYSPGGGDPDLKKEPVAVLFDNDAAGGFNYNMPLAMMAQSALSKTLPRHLAIKVARAVFTRAALLGDVATAKSVVPMLIAEYPQLADKLKVLDRETLLYVLATHPGFAPSVDSNYESRNAFSPEAPYSLTEIDDYRNNWWCATPPLKPEQRDTLGVPFLKPAERQQLLRERERWSQLKTAPTYLGNAVLEWARTKPNDPRLPEALHWVVKATRYGCTDIENGDVSKAAYTLLHRRWPSSEWAAQTKYWFN